MEENDNHRTARLRTLVNAQRSAWRPFKIELKPSNDNPPPFRVPSLLPNKP